MANFLGGLKDKISGIFSGGKVANRFLPSNDLIDTYNMSTGSLFTVNIAAYKVPDTKIVNNKGSVSVQPVSDPEPLAEFQILYSEPSLSITHTHRFGPANNLLTGTDNIFGLGGDKEAKIAGKVISGLQSADALIGTGGSGETSYKDDWNTFGSLDFSKSYQGSDPPKFKLKFTLIASKDPLLEVVIPAVMLTYLSYPKLNKSKEIGSLLSVLDSLGSQAGDFLGLGSTTPKTEQNANKIKDQSLSALDSAKNLVKGASKDKWRYVVGDSPPFWSLSTSNGLYGMANGSLTGVNVEYFGPWLEAPSEQSIIDQFKSLGSSSGFNPASIFPSTSPIDITGAIGSLLKKESTKGGYPSYAVVTLDFENNFSQMFGEEWLTFLTGGQSKISTSIKV